MPNLHNPDSTERMSNSSSRYPTLYFDIETSVRTEVVSAPELWFKPDARLTDPAKIKASLAEKAGDGALSPITGTVLAIGYSRDGEDWCEIATGETTEAKLIERFLSTAHETICKGSLMAGFNIIDFDLPFLLLRAKALKLRVPPSLGTLHRSRWAPSERFVDLMGVAQFGKYDRAGYSLDRVCRGLGIEGKNGDGKFFADTLREDPEKAKAYLLNDIRMTRELGEVLL